MRKEKKNVNKRDIFKNQMFDPISFFTFDFIRNFVPVSLNNEINNSSSRMVTSVDSLVPNPCFSSFHSFVSYAEARRWKMKTDNETILILVI